MPPLLRADHTIPESRKYTHGRATPLCFATHNGVCVNIVIMVMAAIKFAAEGGFEEK
ncbi:hypothetical protein [Acetivibrio cellulolyticus]|uniref:hypothetical protein n=1 Tax=Acetivibrio cellulolyticus TaxID=35830 RepID=UPI0002E3A69B|nr:hypothetical protein [Acetivibrio cellulolyticus]